MRMEMVMSTGFLVCFSDFMSMSSLLGATDEECGQKINVYCELLEKVGVCFSSTRLNHRPIQPVAATQD